MAPPSVYSICSYNIHVAPDVTRIVLTILHISVRRPKLLKVKKNVDVQVFTNKEFGFELFRYFRPEIFHASIFPRHERTLIT